MAYGTVNADLMTTSDGVSSSGLYGFKNRIINGAMVIDQRNAGANVTNIAGGVFSVDRWRTYGNQASKFTAQQNAGSVTPPVGFSNYLGITSSSAYSVGSGDYFFVYQAVEGFNFADCNWGTANAKTVTLSFWVRSSLTGTFGGTLQNVNNDRSYPYSYTINSANTWEQKSITIAGDTTGTWVGATNGIGVSVYFGLGVGSTFSGTANTWAGANYISSTGATSVVGTSGATFYITGVQLEKGSTATSFDYRPYGTELQLCQRYCNVIKPAVSASGIFSGVWYTATSPLCSYIYPVAMRAAPSLTISAASDFIAVGGNNADATSAISMSGTGTTSTRIDITASVSRTAGHGALIQTANSSASLTFSAEL